MSTIPLSKSPSSFQEIQGWEQQQQLFCKPQPATLLRLRGQGTVPDPMSLAEAGTELISPTISEAYKHGKAHAETKIKWLTGMT